MERPVLRSGGSIQEFYRQHAEWVASWTVTDALTWLDDHADEGFEEAKVAEVLRAHMDECRVSAGGTDTGR